jgi:hypothetical protein
MTVCAECIAHGVDRFHILAIGAWVGLSSVAAKLACEAPTWVPMPHHHAPDLVYLVGLSYERSVLVCRFCPFILTV